MVKVNENHATATTTKAWSDMLRKMRTDAGIPQSKMAELLNLPQARISKIEKGDAYLRVDSIQIWARHCGYEMAFLNQEEVVKVK